MPLTPEIRDKVCSELRKNSPQFQTVVDVDKANDARLIGALSAMTAAEILLGRIDVGAEMVLQEAMALCPEINEAQELSAMITDLGAHQSD